MQTKVKELMKVEPIIIYATTTLKEAARAMKSLDCGVLPVGTWDKLEGIITDRDIVIRAVAEGVNTETAIVGDYMSTEVFYCDQNDTLEEAAEKMHEHHVSRLVVKDGIGGACGIITFGCILRKNMSLKEVGKVVECAVGKKEAA